MYLLNNASGACQHTVITEHYANVNWMQIFPKPPACNIIHNGVKIYRIGASLLDLQIAQQRCLSVLDFWNINLVVYHKLEKKLISKQTWFFVEFALDFYCLCSLQKSSSNSTKNWVCFEIYFFRVCNKLPNWYFKNQAQIDTMCI